MLWLAMLELDRFQPLVDRHGRATAEQVMNRAAGLVRELVRDLGVVARYEGDQLAIILHDPEGSGVEHLTERVRKAIEHHSFEPGGHRLTASLGLADLRPELDGVDDLLDDASDRLRRASRLGGNQVCAYDEDMCLQIHRAPVVRPSEVPCLVVIHGAELGSRYDLAGRSLTIGRSASNDIRLDDDSVSRTHATVTADADGVRIRDNGSKNGIHVNGVGLRECVLEYGDVIHVGRTIFALALLDPGRTNLEALDQIARLRLAGGFLDDEPIATDTDAETEAMEYPLPASPSEA